MIHAHPPDHSWWLKARNAAFFAIIFLVGAYAIWNLSASLQTIDAPFPGFRILDDLSIDAQLPPGWSGTQASLMPMDRILRVDGRTLPSGVAFYRYVERKPIGTTLHYELERVSWTGRLERLSKNIPTQQYTRDDWIGNSLGFWITGIFYLLIGAVVSILKPGDRIARSHFAYCLSGSLMYLAIFDATSTFYLTSTLNLIIRAFNGLAALTLVMVFPRRLTRWRFSRIVGLLSCLSVAIALPSLVFYPLASPRPWTHLGTTIYAFLGSVVVILVPIWSAVSKTSSPKEKSQAKIIVGGAFLSLAPMLLLLIGPLTHNDSPILNIGSLFGFILPLAIAYAIVRHQLFDIDIFLRPSLTYTLLSALLVAMYLAVLSIASVHFGSHSWFPNILATILVALTFAPARDRIKAWLDHQFFRTSYDPDAVRTAFTTAAQQVSDRAGLLAAFSNLVEETFHPTSMAVYLRPSEDAPTEGAATTVPDNKAAVSAAPDGLDFSLAIKEQTIGHVRLGPKKSEIRYSAMDLGLLNSLIDQLTMWLSLFDRIDREQAHARQVEAIREAKAIQDQFLSVVSHEMKTPVGIILGAVNFLKDVGPSVDPSKQESYYNRIYRSAEQLAIHHDDLLNAGQVQSGSFELFPMECDIRSLVEEVIDDLQPLADDKQQRLLDSVDAQIGSLVADPQRLRQVLRNLLLNAIKYTPAYGTIQISGARTAESVQFGVQDNGPGIAPENLPKLFQRFTRLGNARQGQAGVGLGLYIIKTIVEAHHGTVAVESEPGNGALFSITLPCNLKLASNTDNLVGPIDK